MTLLLRGIFYPGGGCLFREIDPARVDGANCGPCSRDHCRAGPDASWKYVLTMAAALTALLTSVCDKAWSDPEHPPLKGHDALHRIREFQTYEILETGLEVGERGAPHSTEVLPR
jgi:hypothetical protein